MSRLRIKTNGNAPTASSRLLGCYRMGTGLSHSSALPMQYQASMLFGNERSAAAARL